VHYRVPLNFTWEGMKEARESLRRIDEWLMRLREIAPKKIDNEKNTTQPGEEFEKALDDDLNISAALGFLFETIRETNRAMDRNELDAAAAKAWLNWWERINAVLGHQPDFILPAEAGAYQLKGAEAHMIHVPAEIAQLAKERENARREKNWERSDELRARIFALGWEVRDTKEGQKLTPRASSG
jgi:cysteinyl-tRNA synthetase